MTRSRELWRGGEQGDLLFLGGIGRGTPLRSGHCVGPSTGASGRRPSRACLQGCARSGRHPVHAPWQHCLVGSKC